MHKRILHYYERKLRPISGWYFLAIAVFFLSISAFALRQNNLQMLELREAVFQADEAGEGIEEALRDLRAHVHGHMNTDLVASEDAIRPPIQLTHEYARLLEKRQTEAREQNSTIYAEAESICEQRFPAGQLADGRVQCVEQYVRENGVSVSTVPKELYQFDFVSPRWSPDLAGWTLLLGIFSLSLFVLRMSLEGWFRYKLKQ